MRSSKSTRDILGIFPRRFALGSVQISSSLRVSVLRAPEREPFLNDIPYRPAPGSHPVRLTKRETELIQSEPDRLYL